MYYREKVQYQGDVKGSTDGYHARAGLQIVLDSMDPRASSKMYRDYGVFHTSLFLEARSIRAMVTDLDGTSINLGEQAGSGAYCSSSKHFKYHTASRSRRF